MAKIMFKLFKKKKKKLKCLFCRCVIEKTVEFSLVEDL